MTFKKADAVQAGKPTPDNTSGIGLIHKSSERAKSFLREILSTSKPYKLPESEGSIYETIFQIALYAQDLEERLDMTARGSPSPYILQQASPGPLRLPGPQPKEEQPDIEVEISDPLRKLDLNSGSSKRSYYGKASHLMLVKTALEMMPPTKASFCLDIRRPEFWSVNPWELSEVYLKPQRKYQFPEPDLLVQLITFYFEKACASMPHLHRPSFEREVFVEGKHLYDSQFGVLVLTVCALGSRYSDDRRIFDDGCKSEHNAGWKWIRQIKPFSICSFEGEDPCVYELQALCNYILFNLETSSADVSWLLLGVGVRYAQAVGAHRRKFCSKEPTAEQELWKRAFWLLVCIDCFMSSLWGRPRATVPIDYDQEFPLEVDDEYWEPSEPGGKPFQQPKDKISRISFWGPILRLLRILGIAQRTFLALDKDALESHVWILPDEERVIMELDSDLNQWIDSVPEHLKWNPDQVDSPFFNQAATLHSMYYWITIQIHRPFIPKEGKQNTQLQYSSLAVCTNAARACVRILDVQSKRGILDVHTAQFPLFTSGMLLLLNLWGGSRLGLVGEPSKQLEDVYRCLDVLERLEKRWHIYGRLYDIISGLLSVTGLEKTRHLPYESRKRAREDDNDSGDEQRYEQRHLSPPHEESAIPNYLLELPLYPEELGRMPVHDVSLNLPHSTPFTSQDEFSYQGQAPSGSSSSIWDTSLHAASSSGIARLEFHIVQALTPSF
ncbi:Gypsy retrotransposon integrase-like protein 1 [Paramarasmius palmivorus]|uniref:Gypsy retrotransposon integrase-like protein 1 n=1 Tax=Paramarasmius palmivorus TaxID=297713 RepID=A0AAW0C6X3_9AGAR